MKIVIYILFLCFLFSCKKAEDRSCFKFAGEESELTHYVSNDIDTLYLQDDISYTLIGSNENKIVLTGGENLLNFVNVEFGNGKLTISNENKCKFLRSYDQQISAKVYIDTITYIHYQGSKEVVSQDTLRSSELRIDIFEGAGSMDLTLVNGYTSVTATQSHADFTIKGRTIYGHFHCKGNSYCDTRDFSVSSELYIKSYTVGKMLINADQTKLYTTIENSGNVEYVGNPVSITLNGDGSGELINLNN
ncbi:GIN domain-containing protein [Brumimicrobium aurantiacum]|uniref:Putative auto-transporter adhesin head GIN domain-containing protein n=1 Tax=Brumimicrobium aurantiacum TaxID=1737063 RepID=A0A3E1EUV1_9FLAO|nr:DUF2807 domain-containing protein [Brumimicrobium aurantiacum]RFC53341.1 hypothetical protein DXU93_12985 [Brumimicrobium aurantiacum]